MKGLSGMTPISVSARCCLSIDTLLELCYNNRVIRRYVMKRSLSWLELLWYLPLYIISVYYHLNSVMVLVIVAVGYTVSHYHKYTEAGSAAKRQESDCRYRLWYRAERNRHSIPQKTKSPRYS